jgi:hypothetical protein
MSKGPKLFIDDTPGPEFRQVVARAHALKIRHPEVADLRRLSAAAHDDNETRAEELRGITQRLQEARKEAHIPVVVLAQLNDRDVEKRPDHRPRSVRRAGQLRTAPGRRLPRAAPPAVDVPRLGRERRHARIRVREDAQRRKVHVAILEADMAQMRLRSSHGPFAPVPATEFPATSTPTRNHLMSAVSSYLQRFMANNREVIPWIKMPRWQYRLNKGAHTALITITLIALGVGNWHALAWAIGFYWLIPKTYYLASWFVWRPSASKALRRLRSVFNVPYQPDPARLAR